MSKIFKILTTVVLSISLLISSMPFTADASNGLRGVEDYMYKGTDGSITWTIDRNGVLTLSGNGDYSNVTSETAYPVWRQYRTMITSAVIAVTNIRSAR
ncbi:MAG TPA: hypothetical protein DCZ23_07425, partial [Lachnospiraceae bacterium]|nr:hypothetical protein [Lachnospiraceae bacterium]